MLQLVCERSLLQNLCHVILDSVSSELFLDLSDVVVPAGLSHADTPARACDGCSTGQQVIDTADGKLFLRCDCSVKRFVFFKAI